MLYKGWFSGNEKVWFDKSLVTQDTSRIGRLHHDVPGVCLLVANAHCHALVAEFNIWPVPFVAAHVLTPNLP